MTGLSIIKKDGNYEYKTDNGKYGILSGSKKLLRNAVIHSYEKLIRKKIRLTPREYFSDMKGIEFWDIVDGFGNKGYIIEGKDLSTDRYRWCVKCGSDVISGKCDRWDVALLAVYTLLRFLPRSSDPDNINKKLDEIIEYIH